MACPGCGTERSTGAVWCTSCGLPFEGARCRSCEQPLAEGAHNCGSCGAATTGSAAGGSKGSWGTALLIVGGLGIAGFFALRQPAPQVPPPSSAPAPAAAPAFVPPALPSPAPALSPRDAAGRLFNEAMMAHEQGNTAHAAEVIPKALAAYQALPERDGDLHYHLGTLHLAGGDPGAARAAADAILAENPHHILALGIAADAALASGDAAGAAALHERLLQGYDAESTKQLPEYRDHAQMLPLYAAQARGER